MHCFIISEYTQNTNSIDILVVLQANIGLTNSEDWLCAGDKSIISVAAKYYNRIQTVFLNFYYRDLVDEIHKWQGKGRLWQSKGRLWRSQVNKSMIKLAPSLQEISLDIVTHKIYKQENIFYQK